jgi:hypothetical protein
MSTVQTQTPSGAQAATPTEAVIGVKQLTTLLESMLRTAEKYSGEIELLPRGIEFRNFEGMCRWARYSAASGLAPKEMEKFETCLVAIVIGRAVGLDPFQAVQSIAVVDNRPFLCGDAPLAIARQHQAWDESGYEEYFRSRRQAGRRRSGSGCLPEKLYRLRVQDAEKRPEDYGRSPFLDRTRQSRRTAGQGRRACRRILAALAPLAGPRRVHP